MLLGILHVKRRHFKKMEAGNWIYFKLRYDMHNRIWHSLHLVPSKLYDGNQIVVIDLERSSRAVIRHQ